ncbi:MAG: hypothetical protein HDR42_02465 [Lactobacillus sp.]|nr:hypothetical protein [Lactobacillus sp.]
MKKQSSHHLFRLIILILLLIAGGVGGGIYYYNQQHIQASFNARPPLIKAKDGTSISAGHHSLTAYKKKLSKEYPQLYAAAYEVPKTTKTGSDVIIPGQVVTRAYNPRTNKLVNSSTMTPQGLTIADDYLLITAYDSLHKNNSVIYVLNKKNGKYIKTLYLNGKPHLGGIAYDPIAKKIWFTGTTDGEAALISFSLKQVKEFNYQKNKKFLSYEDVIALPTIQQASCVTYYDNQLFVGFFNEYGNGQLAAYPIARQEPFKNSITSDQIKAITGKVSWSAGAGSATMDRQIQGVAFYNNYIILSQSYGSKNSKLYFFPISAINNLDEKNAEKVIEMPPYLEQITVTGDQLLMIFESGAKAYAKTNIMVMDRLISANINSLIGSN